MSRPKRHRSTRSITAIILSTPFVSAVSLTELGMRPLSRLAPASCKAAYNSDIPNCTMKDFTNGCSKNCQAGVAAMSDVVSRACAGSLLGGLIAPLVSGTDQLLLCANGILASLVGETSTSTKSTKAPLATTQPASTTSVAPPPSTTAESLVSSTTTPVALPTSSSDLASPPSFTNSSPSSIAPTSAPASPSSGSLPFVISFSSSSSIPLTSASSLPLTSESLVSASPIQSLLSSIFSSGSMILSSFPLDTSSTESSSTTSLPPIIPIPIPVSMSSLAAQSSFTPPIPIPITSTSPLESIQPPINSTGLPVSTSIPSTTLPLPVASSMIKSFTSSTSTSASSSSSRPTADVGGITSEVPPSERTTAPNGAIIGGVLGGSIAIAMLTTTLFYFCLRRIRKIRPRRLSSWDFIDRRRPRSEASLISLPPVSYFDSPPVIPREAMLARTNSESRYPRRTQGTSTNYSSILGNYDNSERGSRDVDLRQGSSGPPRWTPLRDNPSPIFEEAESLQTLTFFDRAAKVEARRNRDPGG